MSQVNFYGSLLKAVACTPNAGDDVNAYREHVIEPSKRWRRRWEEGGAIAEGEMREALAALKRVFEVKRVEVTEQRERFREILEAHGLSSAIVPEEVRP